MDSPRLVLALANPDVGILSREDTNKAEHPCFPH
jgi:hypothetical protein